MSYYIVQEDGEYGPFDMIALMRKVKNGSVTSETQLRAEAAPAPQAAASIPELASLFAEDVYTPIHQPLAPEKHNYDLKPSLRSGWEFIQLNQPSVVASGFFLILTTLTTIILSKLPFIGFVLAFMMGYVFYGGYCYLLMKMSRGQVVEFKAVKNITLSRLTPLMMAALIMSIPIGLGLALFTAPLGIAAPLFLALVLLLWTTYLFTPFLIMERNQTFWAALENSRKKALSMGPDSFGILFAMSVINLIAAIFFMVPLLVTLPLTTSIIADMYDKEFAE